MKKLLGVGTIFLREQLDKVTGEKLKNYNSIVLERWKRIKEGPASLNEYRNRAKQIRNNAKQKTYVIYFIYFFIYLFIYVTLF